MYTEEQCKAKWCPHAFAAYSAGYATANKCHCLASGCMHWRWVLSPRDIATLKAEGDTCHEASGFCGLSGKP